MFFSPFFSEIYNKSYHKIYHRYKEEGSYFSSPSVMDAIGSKWSFLRNLEKRIIRKRGIGR